MCGTENIRMYVNYVILADKYKVPTIILNLTLTVRFMLLSTRYYIVVSYYTTVIIQQKSLIRRLTCNAPF
jgi:hypothetical protein